MFEITNSRTHGSLYFVETMNIGAIELMYLVVYIFLTLFWCFEKYGRYWKNRNISFFFYFFGMCYFLENLNRGRKKLNSKWVFLIVYTMYYIFIIILMFWQIWTILEKSKHIILLLLFILGLFCWILNQGKKEIKFKMSVSRLFFTFLTLFRCFDKYGRYWKISKHIILLVFFFNFLKSWIGEERN